jgi:hypothetical protein
MEYGFQMIVVIGHDGSRSGVSAKSPEPQKSGNNKVWSIDFALISPIVSSGDPMMKMHDYLTLYDARGLGWVTYVVASFLMNEAI